MSIIDVKTKLLNVIFSMEGKTIVVQATKDTKFSELSKKFCHNAGIRDRHPSYFSNSHRILPTDNRTLDELNISNQKKIEVVLILEVIGG